MVAILPGPGRCPILFPAVGLLPSSVVARRNALNMGVWTSVMFESIVESNFSHELKSAPKRKAPQRTGGFCSHELSVGYTSLLAVSSAERG